MANQGLPPQSQPDQTENPRTNQPASGIDATLLNALEWRLVGPHRGGRVVAVAGDPTDAQVFYFGATGGGVWKTSDGGLSWENISDGFFKRASVGAIAVAESDPNVIYVGMGEATIRGNVSHGDGGKNWEQVLFRSEDAGAIDLSIDPHNPRILYAAFWEARRLPHTFISGGEGSGIFKSTDGGDTWSEISRNPGLPTGLLGKIGIVASPARAGRVWAIVEAEDGALFRSDDGGEHWQRLSEERGLRYRAWYYQHIYAHPQDADTLWVL